MSSAESQRVEELIPYAKKANGKYRAPCPFCEDDGHRDKKTSLIIRASGYFKCYRCETHGWLDEPPDPAALELALGARPKEEITTFELPAGFMYLALDAAWNALAFADAREYLRSRGVRRRTVRRAKIGVCDYGRWANRVLVPIMSEDGESCYGWSGRLWVKKVRKSAQGIAGLKYLYPPDMSRALIMYNSVALRTETDTPALIVEGVFDVLPFFADACATLGHPSPGQVEMMRQARRPVVAVPDGDAWVEGQMLAARLRFDGQRAGYVRLPPRIDPDEVDPAWLMEEARRSLTRPVI